MHVGEQMDAPQEVRERAVHLADYLLAVRALVEKPVRSVPVGDAWWREDFPAYPGCEVGPEGPAGSWLRVGRPGLPADPAIPAALVPHLIWDLSSADEPRLADGSPADGQALLAQWVAGTWRPWAREVAAAEATRRLHDRLYDLRHRLDVDATRVELVWGHVILSTRIAGERLRYPLLATPVAIEYDAERGTVAVTPQGPPRLQPDALADLDNRRVADLLDLGGPAGQVEIDPWDEQERGDFTTRAVRRLALSTKDIEDGWVLFVRPRQRMVRRFLEQLRAGLAGGANAGALSSILAHRPSQLSFVDDDPEQWRATGERLLMPLPTNEAQESIARRLAEHRSVAVQGPPGTGKTHTIRNLICHLLAHGKRVLVLAQKEDPLRVLRDGLPEQIQPLCLAVLGRSADQLAQLQISVRELADRAATLDKDAEAAWVSRLLSGIERAEAELEQTQDGLRAAAQHEAETYDIDRSTHTAGEVGEWLRRHETELALVPDRVPPGTPAPLDAAGFGRLFDLARRVSPADRGAALGYLPVDGQLPTGEQLLARRHALRDARKVAEALLDRGIAADGVRELGEAGLAELTRALRTAADELARREGDWTDRLGRLVQDPSWRGVWDEHVRACQQLLAELGRRTSYLSGRRVAVPAEQASQPRRLLTELAEVRARFAEGKKPRGAAKRLVSACTVDGEPLRTVADIDLVVALVERGQLRGQLATRWTEWRERLGAPVPTDGAGEPEIWAGRLLATAVDALDWERRGWPALYQRLIVVYPRCDRAVDARALGELAGAVEACGNILVADRLTAEGEALAGWIARVAVTPALTELAAAWRADDLGAWDEALTEIRRLWTLHQDAERFAELAGQLTTVAPQWTSRIEAGEALPTDGGQALRAWQWRQAQTWFEETVGGVDTAALGRRAERCREQIRRLTGELVVGSAWLSVARTLDDQKKAALADWTAALRKIGKGTGKSAGHWQAVAQRAMAEAVTAVPVWVMSIDRALEQFGGGEQIFDVVIVDEASQADIFALPVLTLAKRAVVVGDDQQIGPQLVGMPSDRVRALIDTHLDGVPSAEHFDTESSLYDHAVRRSPERILLTEHFRCVPAIISFSSEHYYDGKIQPLRADLGGVPGAPVNAVYVPGGLREQLAEHGEVNVAEAEALVTRLAGIVADPAYAGRTLGVVSLLSGSGQAAYLQHRIREEIGAEEMERRELRVGDPYTFQGDERDVVLISMVVAGAPGEIGAFTKRDFHRRINVAASRGRDQMWLFHSVRPSALVADDARALLLSWYERPPAAQPTGDPLALCDNDFQRAVLRALHERGLRPVPQFRIGDFRIDFVLAAPDGRRLAVECDGDPYHGDGFAQALRRQAILERVGNCTFVRLRASAFHRDPEAAMAPVWERASELGLTPG
jgi:very-short-patch-repair endonuclease